MRKVICVFIFIGLSCFNSYGIWEPLKGMICDLKQEKVFDFEIVSFEKEPFRIQYKGFFSDTKGEIRYLFTVEDKVLVHVGFQEKCPEEFAVIQVNEYKNEVVINDIVDGKSYSLKLGEIMFRNDRFQCVIRNLKDNQIYKFSDKSLRCLDDQKSLSLSYKENRLVLLLQRKNEVPLAFRFVLES